MAFDVNVFNESSHTRIEFCSCFEDLLMPPPRKTDESFTIRFNVKYTSIEFSCDAMLLLLFLSSSSSPSSLKNASKTFNLRTEIQSTLRNPNGGSYSSVKVSLFFSLFSFAAFVVVASPSTTTATTLAAAAAAVVP